MPLHTHADQVWIYHRHPEQELLLVHHLGMPELRVTIPFKHVAFSADKLLLQTLDCIYILSSDER